MSTALQCVCFFLVLLNANCFFQSNNRIHVQAPTSQRYGTVGGQCWEELETMKREIMLKPRIFHHLGDYNPQPVNDFDAKRKADFNMNVGRALEVLRRELPMVFVVSDLDFSIFAPQITVSDGNGNRLVMQRNLYAAVVKSLRLASTFSFVYPSMNVKKIEYIEDCTTIQCTVDVVLPDSIRIDGAAVWEGMFYFSLDPQGLIESHTFDKKISTMRPSPINANSYPWLRQAAPQWSAELISSVSSASSGGSEILQSLSASHDEQNILDLLSIDK
eukprot:gene8413-17334_t